MKNSWHVLTYAAVIWINVPQRPTWVCPLRGYQDLLLSFCLWGAMRQAASSASCYPILYYLSIVSEALRLISHRLKPPNLWAKITLVPYAWLILGICYSDGKLANTHCDGAGSLAIPLSKSRHETKATFPLFPCWFYSWKILVRECLWKEKDGWCFGDTCMPVLSNKPDGTDKLHIHAQVELLGCSAVHLILLLTVLGNKQAPGGVFTCFIQHRRSLVLPPILVLSEKLTTLSKVGLWIIAVLNVLSWNSIRKGRASLPQKSSFTFKRKYYFFLNKRKSFLLEHYRNLSVVGYPKILLIIWMRWMFQLEAVMPRAWMLLRALPAPWLIRWCGGERRLTSLQTSNAGSALLQRSRDIKPCQFILISLQAHRQTYKLLQKLFILYLDGVKTEPECHILFLANTNCLKGVDLVKDELIDLWTKKWLPEF